jgi:hypothetical protein
MIKHIMMYIIIIIIIIIITVALRPFVGPRGSVVGTMPQAGR